MLHRISQELRFCPPNCAQTRPRPADHEGGRPEELKKHHSAGFAFPKVKSTAKTTPPLGKIASDGATSCEASAGRPSIGQPSKTPHSSGPAWMKREAYNSRCPSAQNLTLGAGRHPVRLEWRLDPWPARTGVYPLDRTGYAARARLEANSRLTLGLTSHRGPIKRPNSLQH